MNVLVAASEIAPFAKTGGLADVVGALPRHLAGLGAGVSLIMPLYGKTKKTCPDLNDTRISISVAVNGVQVTGRLFKGALPNSEVDVYFVGNDDYYARDELYSTPEGDYKDNCERFVFFCRAVIEAVRALGLRLDVIHCNDWHTALIPVYLKTQAAGNEDLGCIATLFTIHNIAYQGIFPPEKLPTMGLSPDLFNFRELEFYGKVNLLKGGLVFSEIINTVSRTYSKEIQTPEFGRGLEGVLAWRSDDLFGVINGIDYETWNPEKDNLIAARYSDKDLSGKKKCKADLQKINKLPRRPDVPLLGVITRLDDQKGLDLIAEIMDDLMKLDVQFVLLGTGNRKYHELFEEISRLYPKKTGINLKFDNTLAHKIESGSDMFLMPSRFEPCGLNQLYSLKYATVPVVRKTGGLADTIVDCTAANLENDTATGFSFLNYDSGEFLAAIKRALKLYKNIDGWRRLMLRGMRQDWSWNRSSRQYFELYEKAMYKAKSACGRKTSKE